MCKHPVSKYELRLTLKHCINFVYSLFFALGPVLGGVIVRVFTMYQGPVLESLISLNVFTVFRGPVLVSLLRLTVFTVSQVFFQSLRFVPVLGRVIRPRVFIVRQGSFG